ncbi:MFS transporter, partial [Burkholderia anthina]|uniref:MFS transporter n=1 Tax=Burkholderia anthina TaxID=179879 RepID=UPI00158D6A98
VSKLAPGSRKGAATGVYNTTQSIGLALGGIAGGWLLKHGGANMVFLVCAGAVAVWFAIASGMKPPPARS